MGNGSFLGNQRSVIQCMCIVPITVTLGMLLFSYSSNDLQQRLLTLGSIALPWNGSEKAGASDTSEVMRGLQDVYKGQKDLLDRLILKVAATEAALQESQAARVTLSSKLSDLQSPLDGNASIAELIRSSTGSAPSGSPEMKAQVAECFTLKGNCETLQSRIMDVGQREQQGWRDMRIKYHAAESVEFLDSPEANEMLTALNITPAGAKEYLKEHRDNDLLFRFVAGQTLYGQFWKRGDKKSTESLRAIAQKAEADYSLLVQEHGSLKGELDVCRGRLLEDCGLQLAGYDWLDEVAIAELDKRKGPEEDRSAIGMVAPLEIAILDPRKYPQASVNISFILQYFKQPETLMSIVERLYACTEGLLGKGQIPGLTTELVVNVDEPSGANLWMEAWSRTAAGEFVVPIFQHNIHENRGYNRAAAASRGNILVMIQDDDLPPENCAWLTDVVTAFDAWPRLGVVGAKGSWFTIGAYDVIDRSSPAYFCRTPDRDDTMLYSDPNTGVVMQFVSVVDLAPMIFRREAFFGVGGFNEANGMKGEAGIFSDWEISFRSWLAGWQVAQVAIPSDQMFRGGLGSGGGTHVGSQVFIRSRNEGFNGLGLNLMTSDKHHNRVFIEVMRMNSMLQLRPGKQKLW